MRDRDKYHDERLCYHNQHDKLLGIMGYKLTAPVGWFVRKEVAMLTYKEPGKSNELQCAAKLTANE